MSGTSRSRSVALREPLREELRRMEKLGVIKKCKEPTAWVHSVVAEKKNNKLRVYMDSSDINHAVMREHFPMHIVEDVISRMPSAKVLRVLDANHGFWQVKLTTDSSKLAIFNTPFGPNGYTSLPFGIASTPDVFQNVMSHLFQDIESVEVIMDDLIMWGKDVEQHDVRLRQILDSCRDRNLKLNREKCQLPLADTLSRAYLPHNATDQPDDFEIHVLNSGHLSETIFHKLRDETKSDPELQQLQKVVMGGWLQTKVETPVETRPYWNHRDEISCYEGLLFKGDRIIVPHSLRPEILQCIHAAHLGIEKCRARAQSAVFWPGINGAIDELVSKCNTCQQHQRSNQREPLISQETPERARVTVAADKFYCKGRGYLLLVDYFSNILK
ncbi:uncharacterized protein K02A2.6-like [Stylophora pistillata]|uniref:uncharacterized protein K02A2.6-like n=1 Tax=Stylophora pistillata TaxID=50429 RepID=UPI000C03B4BA|nr:uncharacterized protein K02A2.6-like [Stylophora pistillata]